MKLPLIHCVFPTPVIQLEFDKHSNYNFSNIPKSVKKPSTWKDDLYTTFPNILDNDSYINSEIRERLKADLKQCINNQFKLLKIPPTTGYSDFWYNVYYDKQGQELHHHLAKPGTINPYWSGIYYYKNSSPTVFSRNSNLYRTQEFSGCLESNLKEFYYKTWYPHVKDGDIILFPPYLEHYVPHFNEPNKMRMTFSFNLLL